VDLFITGTDTGVGKTYVTSALARHLHAAGRRVLAWKPLETGCWDDASGRKGSDAEHLAQATGNWQQGRSRGYHLLRDPLAPKVAAENEGLEIELGPMANYLNKARIGCDDVLVEGAGGWRVPINRHSDIADFAHLLGLPVLIVARASLGTINHSVLTARAVLADGCLLAGIILSKQKEDSETANRNRDEISQRTGTSVHIISDLDQSCIAKLCPRL
jgi:dethiobiotin synthetase